MLRPVSLDVGGGGVEEPVAVVPLSALPGRSAVESNKLLLRGEVLDAKSANDFGPSSLETVDEVDEVAPTCLLLF